MKLQLYFQNDQLLHTITYHMKMLIRHAIETTLEAEQFTSPGKIEVSVTFTDNEGIRALNRRYRRIDAPTDVLSFPQFDFASGSEPDEEWGESREMALGDIVLSLERAAEQAEEFGHSFAREVAFLCVHSTLHLLGYDHERSAGEDADMRARQRRVMELLGLGIDDGKAEEEQ